MFRNQYDSDVTVWSPQGRLHQVDYAVEAMKQGSATVGIKSKTHAVLVALKRAANDLCSHQKKIYELDSHSECASFRWDFKHTVPIPVLNKKIQLKLQANTQYYGRRPFGVGLIVAGYDDNGAHIVKTDPSAEVVEMLASSIGARSQSARTYLERHLDEFANASLEELIKHALIALRDTLPAEEKLTQQNTSVGIVGKGQVFKVMEDEAVQSYLENLTA
uniref:Proteasome subunit alpha type n=1 Tax=Ditylenchus dipsaci TaxID=166011 RepID=A0A915EJ83_9BILA